MQCERVHELFSDYIEGALDPAMQQVMSQHVRTCQSCGAEIEQLRGIYALLSDGLPEVDVPSGFRASILNTIREQKAPDTLMSRVRSWFTPTSAPTAGRAPAAVAVAAVAIAIGVGTWMNVKAPHSAGTGTDTAKLAPWGAIPVSVQDESGILQGVRSYVSEADGKTYHVFGLHLPDGRSAVDATAYVIQSPDALTNDAALADTNNATAAFTGRVEPGVSVQVPVAVVSDVPEGTSMTLLVEWSDRIGKHKEVCILPISKPSSAPMVVKSGEPLYQALQTVAVAYNKPVILDETATAQFAAPIQRSLDDTDTNINDSLADIVLPANMSFGQQPDGSYLIDGS